MATARKTAKSKIISEDVGELRNISQYLQESPIEKKIQNQKRPRPGNFEEDDVSKVIGQYQSSIKKKKAEANTEVKSGSRQKILDLVDQQTNERKQSTEKLFKSLTEITNQIEGDYNAMKENEEKLEHLTGTYMKCIQQASNAYKHKLKALKEIHTTFKKEFEEMESDQKAETDKLVDELDYDIKKLQDTLISESKRSSWEMLRRSIFNAMQNDL